MQIAGTRYISKSFWLGFDECLLQRILLTYKRVEICDSYPMKYRTNVPIQNDV